MRVMEPFCLNDFEYQDPNPNILILILTAFFSFLLGALAFATSAYWYSVILIQLYSYPYFGIFFIRFSAAENSWP